MIKNDKCGLRVTAGDVMKIFSVSNMWQNILTIQLNYDDLDTVETHGKIIFATLNLVDTVTLAYSLGDMYLQIRQFIKSMEISKNILFSGKPSTVNKKEMSPSNLLFCIDAEANGLTPELDFSNSDIGDLHIKRFQPLFTCLEKLDLRGNSKMSSQSMKYISDVLMQSIEENKKCNLKVINIGYCDLTDEHINCLQPCIPYMEHLNISGNSKMSFLSMKYISDALVKVSQICETSKPNDTEISKICNMKVIDMGFCELTDQHIEYLQPCIPYLEKLTISGNKLLTSQGMKYISHTIMQSIRVNNRCNMKEINVSHCNLNDYAIASIVPCLPYLKYFFIVGNKDLSEYSMKLLSEKLGINNQCWLFEYRM